MTEPAEVIAGRALLGDFQRTMHEFTVGTVNDVDFLTWALRLSQHLQQVIAAIGRHPRPAGPVLAQGGSYVAGDGSAWLTASDLAAARRALFHAAADDGADTADRITYDGLRFRLGDDR